MAFPTNEPPVNVVTKGASGVMSGWMTFGTNLWLGWYAGIPANTTDGAGWAGPGSIVVDITNFDIYMNTGTMAVPVWTKKVD